MTNDKTALDMAIASWKGIKYFVEQKHLNETDREVKVPIYPEDLEMLGIILDALNTRVQPCGDAVMALDDLERVIEVVNSSRVLHGVRAYYLPEDIETLENAARTLADMKKEIE